ncbi:transposase [Salinisphaera sp.]|uniref:transposase n=1 Tax=Salinisphaera sp. TaxID=1914330 RepID=UPI003C7AC771
MSSWTTCPRTAVTSLRDRVHENVDAIELFCLPSCLPQLNPDEYCNNDLKARGHRHPPARSARALHQHMFGALPSIQ